jgi:hypothetical protein
MSFEQQLGNSVGKRLRTKDYFALFPSDKNGELSSLGQQFWWNCELDQQVDVDDV